MIVHWLWLTKGLCFRLQLIQICNRGRTGQVDVSSISITIQLCIKCSLGKCRVAGLTILKNQPSCQLQSHLYLSFGLTIVSIIHCRGRLLLATEAKTAWRNILWCKLRTKIQYCAIGCPVSATQLSNCFLYFFAGRNFPVCKVTLCIRKWRAFELIMKLEWVNYS